MLQWGYQAIHFQQTNREFSMELQKCAHPACLDLATLTKQCEFSRTRSGGPGGQHRNKVETTVLVKHRPTGITAKAGERRSQHENKTVAMERLRELLAIQFRSPVPPTSTSPLWQERCRGGKIVCSASHSDYACLLAEALEWISAHEFQVSAAANQLNCTTSQLIKLLKMSENAFAWVNRQRKSLDLGPLK